MDKNLLKYTFGGEREPTFFQNPFYKKIYSMEYSVFWFLFGPTTLDPFAGLFSVSLNTNYINILQQFP